jgi:hypothetical protein
MTTRRRKRQMKAPHAPRFRYATSQRLRLTIPALLALAAAEPTLAASCAELGGARIPAAAIALPTSGARVTAATLVPGGGSAPQTFGPYCDLSVEIAPIDRSAPNIRMRIVLPEQWNSKAMMYGGGGL